MWKSAMLLVAVATMAACQTHTVKEETDTAPTAGMSMSPVNEKTPATPMDRVTDPQQQVPQNGPR
jgi:uncharacterized lipoprotein YajG